MTTNVQAIRRMFKVEASNDKTGHLPAMPGIYPHYPAPIVRNGNGGRELAMARWGMPSSQKVLMDTTKKRAENLQAKGNAVDFKELLRLEPDSGATNIRNVSSAHWKRRLGPENRCLAPFTHSLSTTQFDGKKTPVWFASDDSRPLMCFAGLWTKLDQRAEGRKGRDHCRHIRVPDDRTKFGSRARPSEGHAGNPQDGRGTRRLAACALG
jgi:putative SOS response-associated peptidase YedK